MRYPLGFPNELQRPVEVARDKAETLLLEALSNKTAHRLDEAFNFISRVFPAFAHQACEAERQGHWQGHEGREAVETFLERQLIPHAYELARVRTFFPGPIHSPLSLDGFRHRVMELVKESDMWRAYLAERSALGDPPARNLNGPGHRPESAPAERPPKKVGGPRLAAWLDAEMKRRNHMTDHRLHVLTGLDRKTIKAMRAGKQITEVRRRKLADGLSVPESDIPAD